MTDDITHPAHYARLSPEPLDVIEAWGLDYHTGNVLKYIARAGYKGPRLVDLKKARFYLDRLIAMEEAGIVEVPAWSVGTVKFHNYTLTCTAEVATAETTVQVLSVCAVHSGYGTGQGAVYVVALDDRLTPQVGDTLHFDNGDNARVTKVVGEASFPNYLPGTRTWRLEATHDAV